MRITVIGAGNVGGTLGRRWAGLGHDVTFGLRDPEGGRRGREGWRRTATPRPRRLHRRGDRRGGGDPARHSVGGDARRGARAGPLDGVIVMDATNPLGAGLSLLAGPHGESGGEQVQALIPKARVVKAFSTTGFNNMADPVYDGAPTVMFYAGDDAAAKRAVHELTSILGFDAIDAGPLRRSRELEHMAALWIALAAGIGVKAMGREIAFRLVRR